MLCMPVQVALPELSLQRLMPSLLQRSSVLPWLPCSVEKHVWNELVPCCWQAVWCCRASA